MADTTHILTSIAGHFRAALTVGGKGRSATLTIASIEGGRRTMVSRHDVAGKREARALAKTLGATPWNF
jgi:hypothetical protein